MMIPAQLTQQILSKQKIFRQIINVLILANVQAPANQHALASSLLLTVPALEVPQKAPALPKDAICPVVFVEMGQTTVVLVIHAIMACVKAILVPALLILLFNRQNH